MAFGYWIYGGGGGGGGGGCSGGGGDVSDDYDDNDDGNVGDDIESQCSVVSIDLSFVLFFASVGKHYYYTSLWKVEIWSIAVCNDCWYWSK